MNFDKISSSQLRSFLSSSREATLKFWHDNLREALTESKSGGQEAGQTRYVAQFLTNFSLISTASTIYFPTFSSLVQIYDNFLHNPAVYGVPDIMEAAGCNILLLSGFYMEYAKKHYDLNDLCRAGADSFRKSATGRRKKVLIKMAVNFAVWQDRLHYLNWHLQNKKVVIIDVKNEEPLIKIVYS